MFHLQCSSMNYDWGKNGEASLVYRILSENEQSDLKDDIPYAELWMGDHPKGPSRTRDGVLISKLEGCNLPFLFKVLSIQKPLSIQVHPNRELSSILHSNDPVNYPDGNHKPEMSFFIKKTKLLYGFRRYEEIIDFFRKIDELRELVDESKLEVFIKDPTPDNFLPLLREIFHSKGESLIRLINSFLKNIEKYEIDGDLVEVVLLIHQYFPNDVGVFLPFITNVVEGEPGMSLFIPTGVIHSYLYGDLLEAMALSDNVIRAGMTPKHIDVDILLKTVNCEPTPIHWVEPKVLSPNHIVFIPPLLSNEFLLHSYKFEANTTNVISDIVNESILLVLDGFGIINNEEYHKSSIILTLKNQNISVTTKANTHIIFCTHSNTK